MIRITAVIDSLHPYICERHDPLDLSAVCLAVASATEEVRSSHTFDATARGYLNLIEAVLEPTQIDHEDDCDCDECPF